MPTLDEYAAPLPASGCRTCNLPRELLSQVHTNQRRDKSERFSLPIVARWLAAEGQLDITEDSLRAHFRRHHESRFAE